MIVPGTAAAGDCLDEILAAERDHKIPSGLLLAMAMVESGKSGIPHAYAMNVQGRPVYARSEADAARHLRDSKGQLRGNVMAGCMQIAVGVHKSAFRPLETIVNPSRNVTYAARYLVRLRAETGSWAKAVARYNGGGAKRVRHYQCNVRRQLVGLDLPTAGLFDGLRCKEGPEPNIAPRTRQAVEQIALLPQS